MRSLCFVGLVGALATTRLAAAPDDRSLAYIPANASFYALVDVRTTWTMIAPYAPPGSAVGGRPAAPDPKLQLLVDFAWNAMEGAISIAGDSSQRFYVVARAKSTAQSQFNQVVSQMRAQGLVESVISKPSATAIVTILKMTKSATVKELVVAFVSDLIIVTDTEASLAASLQAVSGGKGLATNADFAAARSRSNVTSGQLLWVWGRPPGAGTTVNFSVRSEAGGIAFAGFVPLPRK